MTLRALIEGLGGGSWILVAGFLLLPLSGWILARLCSPGIDKSAWRYPLSAVVYLVCIPGILAAVLSAYTLFFTSESLLDVNLAVYLLPLVSMVVTLALISRLVPFDRIPGFDRLSGLMVMIALSFIIALALEKTRIWLVFGAPMTALLSIALIAFGLLRWSSYALFRGHNEVKKNPSDFIE